MSKSFSVLLSGFLAVVLPFHVFGSDRLLAGNFGIGVDAALRLMPLENEAGGNFTSKRYEQGDLYGQLKLSDFFRIELGYQNTLSADRQRSFVEDSYFGVTDPNPAVFGLRQQSYTRSSIKGFYGSLVGMLPVSEAHRLQLIGAIGLSRLSNRIESRIDWIDPATGDVDPLIYHLVFKKKAWVPKLSVGLQHMINSAWSVRALYNWERTAKFSRMSASVDDGQLALGDLGPVAASIKNSQSISLGISYNF